MSGDKKDLRREILARRSAQTEHEIRGKSEKICRGVLDLPEFAAAGAVLLFASFGSEVRTHDLITDTIRLGKRALLPVVIRNEKRLMLSQVLNPDHELTEGEYGIPEPGEAYRRPVPPEEVDLLISPGLGFDLRGNRLGYGGGYYDRLRAGIRPGVPVIALAFELQIVKKVPTDAHDLPVDAVVTEDRVIRFK